MRLETMAARSLYETFRRGRGLNRGAFAFHDPDRSGVFRSFWDLHPNGQRRIHAPAHQ
jgi:hypothetical protein